MFNQGFGTVDSERGHLAWVTLLARVGKYITAPFLPPLSPSMYCWDTRMIPATVTVNFIDSYYRLAIVPEHRGSPGLKISASLSTSWSILGASSTLGTTRRDAREWSAGCNTKPYVITWSASPKTWTLDSKQTPNRVIAWYNPATPTL